MSRIGKKPITLPKGVKYTVQSNIVVVEGPKGKVNALIPAGITFSEKDGVLTVERPDDAHAAVHGLARALVFNAVEGVTNGWKKELDVVGIGYRVEMKGKDTVVFTLGYSHPIEFPLPTGIKLRSTRSRRTSRSRASIARRLARLLRICARCASRIRTRTRVFATPTRSSRRRSERRAPSKQGNRGGGRA
jgi:ribosomal protein L6P/L9E